MAVEATSLSKPRIITADEAGQAETWHKPSVGEGKAGATSELGNRLLTAERLEQIQEEARKEGLEQGRREGLEQGLRKGRAMLEERVAVLDSLVQAMAEPMEKLDEIVEEDLVKLVFGIARQLVRREIRTQPDEIIAVIRLALDALPTSVKKVKLYLHPADAQLAKELMSLNDQEHAWIVIEDPSLTRGGCRVKSETSQIDATVETRLNAVIAEVLGEERQAGEDIENDDTTP